jgi:hypothetical protein
MEIVETVVEVESEGSEPGDTEALIRVVVLEVSGDCSEEDGSKKLFNHLTADADRRHYIVDLRNAFVDSRCVAMLIRAVRKLREAGEADVRFVAPVLKPLHYGVGDSVFNTFSNREEALKSYKQSAASNSGCLSTVLLWLIAITSLRYMW